MTHPSRRKNFARSARVSHTLTLVLLLLLFESAVSEYYEFSQKDGRSIRCPVPGLRFPLSVYFKGRSSTNFTEILRVEDEDKRRTLRQHKITFDDHQAIYINNLSLGDEGEYQIIAGSPEEILLYMKVTVLPSFRVIGPSAPVVAVVGQDVLLSCHLSPPVSAENMQIRWFRKNFESLVHLFENGMDQNKQQLPEYQNRTKLFRDRISNGNVSLRIRHVRPTDEGRYTCYVESDIYEEATMELKIVPQTDRRYKHTRSEGQSVQGPIPGLSFPVSIWFKGRNSTDFTEILRAEDEDQRRSLSHQRITFDSQYICVNNLSLSDEGEYKVIAGSPEKILLDMNVTVTRSTEVGRRHHYTCIASVFYVAVFIYFIWKSQSKGTQSPCFRMDLVVEHF
ncbi:butyrophilin subfamily 1 member A1 [Microcaecilia unicolor]|uniref:Butyrophilin subfamily 1 member A1-like n=1 Tax=Microcaecilia unicolor TaxID=1415580 RepID=A0A6P7XBA4_9AMPH|nr:butyrophilin subfamily 1 member A1-like [Microcaecilia unicolor]